ncbi:MAG: hypothetical protein J7L82_04065 [Staphylothermus sp.]|nr:hypothetical protein [Staphylothermus sp.]
MNNDKKTVKYTTVSIPITLYNRIKKMIEGTGFTSVSQFVTYVLREVIIAHEESTYKEPLTEEEKQKIIEKLKKLGYI